MKQSNFTKLCNIALDPDEDISEMFNKKEVDKINYGEAVWVVSAQDSIFSGWGMSKGRNNHVFVICWSRSQVDAIEDSFKSQKNMSYVSNSSLEYFIHNREKHHRGTWSIKNANDCSAWNRGIKVEV